MVTLAKEHKLQVLEISTVFVSILLLIFFKFLSLAQPGLSLHWDNFLGHEIFSHKTADFCQEFSLPLQTTQDYILFTSLVVNEIDP